MAIFAILPYIGTALTWLGRFGLAAFGINEFNKLTKEQRDTIENSVSEAMKEGLANDDLRKLIAASTYDKVESEGKDPDDFWAGLSPVEKEALQFSPETLRHDMQRTKFLGIGSAILFVGALFSAGYGAARGIPVLLSTLAKLRDARAAGASALQLLTIVEEGKIAGIARVWVPGVIAGILTAAGWLTSTMTNNLNDATLWGRIFLGQAADDFEKAQRQTRGGTLSTGGGTVSTLQPKVIVRMVTEKKPEQFIGTLFSAKLGKMESFTRKVDDEITDEADLIEDVKLNLNHWLATFPGRLGYSVVIRKDPVDEVGTKQSGIWATLTLHMTRLNGAIQPIDTILLGPVSPATRLALSKSTKTIEAQIPGMLTGQEVIQVEVPGGAIDLFDMSGERVDLSTPRVPAVSLPTGGTAFTTTTPTPTTATTTPPSTEPPPKLAPAPAPSPTGFLAPTPSGVQTTTPTTTTTTPTTTTTETQPAAPTPEYDRTKYLNGERGAFLDRVGIYANRLHRVDTGGVNLNVRRTPNLASEIIHKLPHGTVVPVVGGGSKNDGFTWVDVLIPGTNRTGSSAYEFLKPI